MTKSNLEKKILTIGIPTYNRAEFLEKILKKISTFSSDSMEKVRVLVVDNDSDDETAEVVSAYSFPWLEYEKNSSNIGATRNLFRLQELCSTEYLWWMGDDDSFEEENVLRALSVISSEQPDLLVINRKVESEEEVVCDNVLKKFDFKSSSSLSSFIESVGVLTGLGCISTLIFKKIEMAPRQLEHFFDLKTSYPHLAFIIESFHSKKCVFDVNNVITTFTGNVRPETYESGSMNLHLVKMATGIPRIYSAYIRNKTLDPNVFNQSREISWSSKTLIRVSNFHLRLFLVLCLVLRIQFNDMVSLAKFYFLIRKPHLSLIVTSSWCVNQVLFVLFRIFRFFGIEVGTLRVLTLKFIRFFGGKSRVLQA